MTVSAGGGDSRDGGHSGQRERPIGSERLSPQLCKLVIWRLSSVANTQCAAAIAALCAAIAAEPTNNDPTYLPAATSIRPLSASRVSKTRPADEGDGWMGAGGVLYAMRALRSIDTGITLKPGCCHCGYRCGYRYVADKY